MIKVAGGTRDDFLTIGAVDLAQWAGAPRLGATHAPARSSRTSSCLGAPAVGAAFFLDSRSRLLPALSPAHSLQSARQGDHRDLSGTVKLAVCDGAGTPSLAWSPDPELPALGLLVVLCPALAAGARRSCAALFDGPDLSLWFIDALCYSPRRRDSLQRRIPYEPHGSLGVDSIRLLCRTGWCRGCSTAQRSHARRRVPLRLRPKRWRRFWRRPPVARWVPPPGTRAAMLRLDRAATRFAAGVPLIAGGMRFLPSSSWRASLFQRTRCSVAAMRPATSLAISPRCPGPPDPLFAPTMTRNGVPERYRALSEKLCSTASRPYRRDTTCASAKTFAAFEHFVSHVRALPAEEDRALIQDAGSPNRAKLKARSVGAGLYRPDETGRASRAALGFVD